MPARARTDAVEWDDSVLRYTNQLRHMDFLGWKNASREVVRRFSAVAFNFARVLCDSLADVPIGIICNAVFPEEKSSVQQAVSEKPMEE